MCDMTGEGGLTELREACSGRASSRCLSSGPASGWSSSATSRADGLLTSDGTVYPLLNRLRDAGLVTSEWRDDEGERARRYYSITEAAGRADAFRADWAWFSATVGGVLNHADAAVHSRTREKGRHQ